MPSRRALAAFVLLLSSPSFAAPIVANGKIDAGLVRAIETGLIGPTQKRVQPGTARALLELAHPATDADLAALEAMGVRLARVSGKILHYRRFVPVTLDRRSLTRVGASPLVAHVSAASERGPLPLDRSTALIRLAAARSARPELLELTGKGVTVGDVDSAVDIFHPTFFRGDGGYFDWIDSNGDKVFTPGVDAIDLDRDGVAQPGEIPLVQLASLMRTTGTGADAPIPREGPAFDPGIDWLYLDTNGNMQRDHGAAAGFDDSTPALGEPLFTPDDVNKNGKLDVGERVIRLSTSKFKKVFVQMRDPEELNDLFERGVSLAASKSDYTGGQAYGYPDALHATAVASIIAGDLPLAGRRLVGIAPDVDLLMAWDTGSQLPVDGATWALMEGAQVMLYELAPWTGSPLDGSDGLSRLIDESAIDQNVVHTCPTGDQGYARKHARLTIAPGASATMKFNLPATIYGQLIGYAQVSLNSRGGALEDVVLTSPSGASFSGDTNGNHALPGGAIVGVNVGRSPRNTGFNDMVFYSPGSAMPIEPGEWTITVSGDPTRTVTLDGFVMDNIAYWSTGATWDKAIVDERSTIGIPSVADHCIAVNSFPAHVQVDGKPWFNSGNGDRDVPMGTTEAEGEIRVYSPRGPRIDGVTKPDITAPDNPFAAAEVTDTGTTPYASYRVFGGTSGASPHVTGAAALLVQSGLSGDDVRDAIRASAITDTKTGMVPNSDYGYGRLDIAAALGVKSDGAPFSFSLKLEPAEPAIGDKISISIVATGATDGLQAVWDDGYDGSWDTAYEATTTRALDAKTPGTYAIKVRARNGGGHVEEQVLRIEVGAAHGGCSCRVGERATTTPWLALLVGGAFLVLRRRRAR